MTAIDLSSVGRTNCTYSGEEAQIILKALSDAQRRLYHLDVNFTKRAVCSEKRRGLLDDIDRYNVALAPHKKLPEDILRYIFTLCSFDTPMRFPSESKISQQAHKAPQLVLSHMCTAWRRVTLDMPQLWNNVHVSITRRNTGVDIIHHAREWLTRSKGVLIYMEIYVELERANQLTHAARIFSELIVPHRFRKLHVHINDVWGMWSRTLWDSVTLAEAIVALEHVEDLRLNYRGSHWSREVEAVPVCLPVSFPHLRSLQLDIGHWVSRYDVGIPWHSLTDLDMFMYPLPASWCLSILRQCTSLRATRLCVTERGTESGSETDDVHLPNLAVLFLNLLYFEKPANDFLRPLVTPKLISLWLWPGENTWDTTDRFIAKRLNFANLLVLIVTSIGDMDLTKRTSPLHSGDLLAAAPSLNEITLPTEATLDEESLTKLSNGQLGPRLQKIVFGGFYTRNAQRLLEMVEARNKYACESALEGVEENQGILPFKYIELPTQESEAFLTRAQSIKSRYGVDVRLRPTPLDTRTWTTLHA
ncbi:hypothetical protein AX17_007426 [Amanita inopinata Kibby_2008]|nr:hypothetical protein AX17_007426 [Amanita inopinata Kibby_2008]